jgi:DNA-binding NarL/FixJ family response regulator
MPDSIINILYIEDDDVDFWALERALDERNIKVNLIRASTPESALDRLKGTDGKHSLGHPYIILLDINLPGYNGIDFLRKVRSDAQLKPAIVFALSTSINPKDIREAYELNVAGYFLKKTSEDSFSSMLNILEPYLNSVQFPEIQSGNL